MDEKKREGGWGGGTYKEKMSVGNIFRFSPTVVT